MWIHCKEGEEVRRIVYYNILTYSFTVLVSNSAGEALNEL
jgi:hypothetical protein